MKAKNRIWLCLLIGLILILINSCKKDEESTDKITDKDGNIYTSVTIGTQVWMVENLKTTKYNDGSAIPYGPSVAAWVALGTTPGYCWYNYDVTNKATYGALYNWYVIEPGKLCPIGWHIPTSIEWTTLGDYLGGIDQPGTGGKLKEKGTAHWNSPNEGATNESGFTALPSGHVQPGGGSYAMGNAGGWWSTDVFDPGRPYYYLVLYNSSIFTWDVMEAGYGVGARCIKNN